MLNWIYLLFLTCELLWCYLYFTYDHGQVCMKYSWFYFNMYMIMVAMHCEVGLINLPVDLNIAVIYVYIAFLFDVYLCFQRMHATYACVCTYVYVHSHMYIYIH